jgi:hypothetical protein
LWKELEKNAYLYCTKIVWMLVVLFAPEVLLGAALGDFISAEASRRDMKAYASEDGVPWTLSHGFLANMGGFVVNFDNPDNAPGTPRSQPRPQSGGSGRASLSTQVLRPELILTQSDGAQLDSEHEHTQMDAEASAEESPTVGLELETGIHLQKAIAIDEKGRKLSSYGLVLDQEVCTFGSDFQRGSTLPTYGNQRTFDTFKIVVGSKRFLGRLDDMMSLSTLASRNVSRPWKLGPATWAVDEKNLLAIQEVLANLKPANKQMVLPLYLNLAALQGNTWVLDARQLQYARGRGIIKVPDLSEDSLQDKNKGDTFVKILALGQIVWLIAQVISRGVSNLPSAQIEIMTLGFAACTSITYILLLQKPKDVNVTTSLQALRYPTPEEALSIANFGPTSWYEYIFMERWTNSRRNYWISNTASHSTGEKKIYTVRWGRFGAFSTGFTLGALIVGGLHILAWNNIFPTNLERTLWRVSSVLSIGSPFLIFLARAIATCVVSILVQMFCYRRKRNTSNVLRVRDIDSIPRLDEFLQQFPTSLRVFLNVYYATTVFLCVLVYILVRLFILVEVVRSLFFLPPEAFIATWSSNVPHIG